MENSRLTEIGKSIRRKLQTNSLTTDELLQIFAEPKLKKEYFNMLIAGNINIASENTQGQTALFKAAESGNLVIVRALLEHGLDPAKKDIYGETPLGAAIRCGNRSVAEALLEITADPASVADNEGTTLLHKAAWGNLTPIASLLLDKYHFNVDCRDNFRRTPAHTAAYQGNTRLLKYLLTEKSADINARDADGRTPLFSSAYDSNIKTIKLLCELGADWTLQDKYGLTVTGFAQSQNNLAAAKFLSRLTLV